MRDFHVYLHNSREIRLIRMKVNDNVLADMELHCLFMYEKHVLKWRIINDSCLCSIIGLPIRLTRREHTVLLCISAFFTERNLFDTCPLLEAIPLLLQSSVRRKIQSSKILFHVLSIMKRTVPNAVIKLKSHSYITTHKMNKYSVVLFGQMLINVVFMVQFLEILISIMRLD